MTQPLPKWIMNRYSKLWSKFKNSEFNHKEAYDALGNDNIISVVLSELKKAGWLDVRLTRSDSRKRAYKLKCPEKAVMEISRNHFKSRIYDKNSKHIRVDVT